MPRPTVAVVGRPNVGKSTLVNRILGKREAIVEERPRVTRDRKVVEAEWNGRAFTLVDTGGWLATDDPLDRQISAQSERAISESDVILMVVDTAVGITEEDERVAALLRRSGRPVLVVANKVDSENRENDIWEFGRLGLGDPFPLSALHGRGSGDLLDEVVRRLPPPTEDEIRMLEDGGEVPDDLDQLQAPGIAIVGRPNVGKSTLFNRLIGEDRSVVHDEPGTTRDTIDTVVDTEHGPSGSSTPPGCAARAGSTRAPSTTRWCGRSRRSIGPRRPCW